MARHSADAAVRIDALLYKTTKDIADRRGAWLKTYRQLKVEHKKQCNNMHCNCGLELLPPLPKFLKG